MTNEEFVKITGEIEGRIANDERLLHAYRLRFLSERGWVYNKGLHVWTHPDLTTGELLTIDAIGKELGRKR